MAYVGSIASVNPGAGAPQGCARKTIEDMKTDRFERRLQRTTSQSYQIPAILRNLGGFQFKIVCGYPARRIRDRAQSRRDRHGVERLEPVAQRARGRDQDGVFVPVIQSGRAATGRSPTFRSCKTWWTTDREDRHRVLFGRLPRSGAR